jgi:hypothetical protein
MDSFDFMNIPSIHFLFLGLLLEYLNLSLVDSISWYFEIKWYEVGLIGW